VNGTTFNRIVEGDVVFNDGWDGCGFYENFSNLAEVATHELGHVLGLSHSTDATATMHSMAHFDGRGASLRADDENGLRAIYPATDTTPPDSAILTGRRAPSARRARPSPGPLRRSDGGSEPLATRLAPVEQASAYGSTTTKTSGSARDPTPSM
jgi:hypothetical protein